MKDLVPCLEGHDPEHCADTELPARTYRARLADVEGSLASLRGTRDRLTRKLSAL